MAGKMVQIIVEKQIGVWKHPGKDPTITETVIERPMDKHGAVVFDGRWVKPELRADGKYYLRIELPAPTTPTQAAINRRCSMQLAAMAMMAMSPASPVVRRAGLGLITAGLLFLGGCAAESRVGKADSVQIIKH